MTFRKGMKIVVVGKNALAVPEDADPIGLEIALDMLGPVMNARDVSGMEGVVDVAANLITCEEQYDHLVRMLLGKTLP